MYFYEICVPRGKHMESNDWESLDVENSAHFFFRILGISASLETPLTFFVFLSFGGNLTKIMFSCDFYLGNRPEFSLNLHTAWKTHGTKTVGNPLMLRIRRTFFSEY